MEQVQNYNVLLKKIMDLDENVRFCTVCDMDGHQLASNTREGANLYLSPEETQETLKHAIAAWNSRTKHYDKIGKGLYTLAVYEKLRRATIPLPSGNLLLVTIDNKGGQQQILDRILNLVVYKDPTVG